MDNLYEKAENIFSALSSPESGFRSVDLYGPSVQKAEEGSMCSGFHLENETGTGDITLYPVFPGMELAYNDLHLEYCRKTQNPRPGIIEINYCREGRCECAFEKQSYCYMSSGDLSICSLQRGSHTSSFPTSHYHGITIMIDLAAITEETAKILELLSIDLKRLLIFSGKQDFYMLRANETVRHIFSELYTVPDPIRPGYLKVKIMELLLILTEQDFDAQTEECVYFSQNQRDCIRQIHDFMAEHITEHFTIEELAERFEISPTAMKNCFKGIYGVPIYAYFRTYRLQLAERYLREGQLSVGEIASKIGYTNPNKFTSAFHSKYGMSPTVYKKNV